MYDSIYNVQRLHPNVLKGAFKYVQIMIIDYMKTTLELMFCFLYFDFDPDSELV